MKLDIFAFPLVATVLFAQPAQDQSAAGLLKRGRGQITAVGAQMGTLAQFLAIDVRRPVTNRTGLTGHYDFKVEWTPDAPPDPSRTIRPDPRSSPPCRNNSDSVWNRKKDRWMYWSSTGSKSLRRTNFA
jgi:uncharacterized protein (TIGR03435 family)